MPEFRLTGAVPEPSRFRRKSTAARSSSSLAWLLAWSSLFGCVLDKLEVSSRLCPPGSTSGDCVAMPRAPGVTGDEGRLEAPPGPDARESLPQSNGGTGEANAPVTSLGDGAAPVVSPPVRMPDKLDLLFMIDNSVSMRDKQNVLELVNVSLITALATPPCVPITEVALPVLGDCPEGQARAFHPITDIHIGFVSSSLGDVGANVSCPTNATFALYVPERADMAHLIGGLPRGMSTGATADGFLAWTAGMDVGTLNNNFQRSLRAVGERGCGWEMSLESWYRFLIDPYPYRELVRVQCPGSDFSSEFDSLNCVQPATEFDGTVLLDTELLNQRRAFLRPDSLVAIVMLTDENDCSVEPGSQTWVALAINDSRPMFRSSSTCETNPNHPCCYSCPLGVPDVCDDAQLDPICTSGALENRLPPEADGVNLRCFDQRRRFGFDFLYPTERYVNALVSRTLCPRSASLDPNDISCAGGALVPNPLYADGQRDPSDVFLMGIVGVPWQHLAASVDARGNALPESQLRYKSAAELGAEDWANILGDPHLSPPEPPNDPLMRESAVPRDGVVSGNPINGRDYDSGGGTPTPDDLQYACIFPLPQPRDCTIFDINVEACDCFAGATEKPLCEEFPGTSPAGTTQHWAKAYPGLRQLDVLRGYGENSVVTSICARNVEPLRAAQPDFAYRPAINALVERLTQRLGAR